MSPIFFYILFAQQEHNTLSLERTSWSLGYQIPGKREAGIRRMMKAYDVAFWDDQPQNRISLLDHFERKL